MKKLYLCPRLKTVEAKLDYGVMASGDVYVTVPDEDFDDETMTVLARSSNWSVWDD